MTVNLNSEEHARYLEIRKSKVGSEKPDESNVRHLIKHSVDPNISLEEIEELRDSEPRPHPYQM